jgi:hypothetical protein
MQRKDLENSMIMEQKARKDLELQSKKDALKKERDNKGISEDKYRELLLGLELGADVGKILAGPGGEAGFMESQQEKDILRRERAEAKRNLPENVAMRTADLITQVVDESSNLDAETQAEVKKIVSTPNISESAVRRMLNDIRETQAAITEKNRIFRMVGPDFGSLGAFAK